MKQLILCLFGVLLLLGCNKEETTYNDNSNNYCVQLKSALLLEDSSDSHVISTIINFHCLQFPPKPTKDDPEGHADNLDSLINKLNNDCSELQVKKICYACLESIPPLSIIQISVDSSNIMVKKLLHLTAPFNNFMKIRC